MGCRVTVNNRVSEIKFWVGTLNNICILLCYLTFPPFLSLVEQQIESNNREKKYSAEHPQIKLGSLGRIQVWNSVQKTLNTHIIHLTYAIALQLSSG